MTRVIASDVEKCVELVIVNVMTGAGHPTLRDNVTEVTVAKVTHGCHFVTAVDSSTSNFY